MIGKIAISIALSAASAFTCTVPACATVTAQQELIPLYAYPGPTWDYACSHAPVGSVLIANPNNGPGNSKSIDYANQFDSCHKQGQRIIGYVDTAYGRKTLKTVKAQIDKWYSFYGLGLDGIFLDEMSHNPTDKTNTTDKKTADAYYSTLFNYVRGKGTNSYVVQNPGDSAETNWQEAYADMVVVFEGPFNDGTALDLQHYTPPPWIAATDPTRIGMLSFATPLPNFPDACNKLKADNAGFGFVEKEVDGYWDLPPSQAEFDANRTYCG